MVRCQMLSEVIRASGEVAEWTEKMSFKQLSGWKGFTDQFCRKDERNMSVSAILSSSLSQDPFSLPHALTTRGKAREAGGWEV